MVVRTIVHFEIPANDVERLARFYRECLGWQFRKVELPGLDYWLIATGPPGKSVGGGMYRKMSPDERPRNFVAVEAIDPAIRAFLDAGGTQVVGKMEVPGQGWSFVGADPEGNVLALWEPLMPARRSPAARRKPARSRRPSAARRRRR
jgi:uncharacterized protein